MTDQDLQAVYIDKLNTEVLPGIDLVKLDRSCNGRDMGYAADVLKSLHEVFVQVYGTEDLDSEYEFTCVPAVLRGRTTGHLAAGLVLLDLQSAGEHYGSYFFTPLGIIDDGAEDNGAREKRYLREHYQPYDYWYTVDIQRDHHVDFNRVPEAAANLLNQVYDRLHPEQRGISLE